MSADRYEIDMHDDGTFIITNLNGHRFIVDANCVDIRSRAIRQQARDLDQLRTDLAAAVAERGEYWGALHSTKDDLFECRANQRTLESDLRVTRDQRDTLRARLAAIEAAPTVAMLCPLTESAFNESTLMTAYQKAKMPHVELIARPAKD